MKVGDRVEVKGGYDTDIESRYQEALVGKCIGFGDDRLHPAYERGNVERTNEIYAVIEVEVPIQGRWNFLRLDTRYVGQTWEPKQGGDNVVHVTLCEENPIDNPTTKKDWVESHAMYEVLNEHDPGPPQHYEDKR